MIKRFANMLERLECRCLLTALAYDWKSVAIKGNGFIDGIVYSPAQQNEAYIHTDMGGAYRWDNAGNKWMPMNDWSQWNDWAPQNLGVETLAEWCPCGVVQRHNLKAHPV